jgi:agmatinase
VIGAGAVTVLLGGDDSLPIPLIGAFAATGRRVWVVQIDAHIDWRDEVQGERLGLSSPMRRASEMAHVAGIVQIGQRGIGSARESDLAEARAWGVRFHPMRAIAAGGIGAALADVPEGAEVILCFDWDAMDQSAMPAVIARMPGGLGYWQAVELIAGIAGRARIAGLCFAEFMAARDIDGIGARTAAQLVTAAVGIVARMGTDV